MRYLIISDIHANYEALRAVLDAAQDDYKQIICCGDLVGYGPDPDRVTDWVREKVPYVIRGNHDRACAARQSPEEFNESARKAVEWTGSHLKPENLAYLLGLPAGPLDVAGKFEIVHGSPRDEDEYVSYVEEAASCFPLLRYPLTFFGHTHWQGGFVRTAGGQVLELPVGVPAESTFRLLEIRSGESYYLNPGSVGQPRDQDPRAAFAIYDTRGYVEYRRASYDLESTVRKMQQAGLPEYLSYRLSIGR